MTRSERPAITAILAGLALTWVAGCSHLPRPHWPWHHQPARGPQEVHELDLTSAEGSPLNLPQYWKRNTLVVDLQRAGATGSIVMKPREHTLWPVRIALRVMPGQFAVLEVRAKQRVLLPVSASGSQPVDLELAPGVYVMKTPEMTVTWGPELAAAQ